MAHRRMSENEAVLLSLLMVNGDRRCSVRWRLSRFEACAAYPSDRHERWLRRKH
jgi:hypothetical protein